jgi:uncharacterized lipoprotein YddW (UPF0748 family)
MYDEVKKIKPWVLVGISPIGIWRPDNPKGVKGFDSYAEIFADSRKWTNQGWLDYLTPQIYWQVGAKEHAYETLLPWWADQNVKQRHLWPGNFTSKIGVKPDKKDLEKLKKEKKKQPPPWTADDILRQIAATRAVPGATGNVHFSMKALMKNKEGIADKLKKGPYAEPALVPESPWLGHETPEKPEVSAKRVAGGVAVETKVPKGKEPSQWLVRVFTTKGWKTSILPGAKSEQVVSLATEEDAKAVTVSGISRLGKEGPSTRAKVAKRD